MLIGEAFDSVDEVKCLFGRALAGKGSAILLESAAERVSRTKLRGSRFQWVNFSFIEAKLLLLNLLAPLVLTIPEFIHTLGELVRHAHGTPVTLPFLFCPGQIQGYSFLAIIAVASAPPPKKIRRHIPAIYFLLCCWMGSMSMAMLLPSHRPSMHGAGSAAATECNAAAESQMIFETTPNFCSSFSYPARFRS